MGSISNDINPYLIQIDDSNEDFALDIIIAQTLLHILYCHSLHYHNNGFSKSILLSISYDDSLSNSVVLIILILTLWAVFSFS